MTRNLILFLLVILAAAQVAHAADAPVIVPEPKSMQISGSVAELSGVAIVIGSKATEPEQFAAGRLAKYVSKRFGQEWPIVRDGADLKQYGSLIILGQPSTNKLVATACRDLKIDPSEKFPIQDGYVLGVGRNDGKTVAVVAGSNPRSVVYGQDTLFQLLTLKAGSLKIWPAKIKDWPSLEWRGRVCSSPEYWHKESVLDAAALGRLNFIDVRYGNYGTPPDQKLDNDTIKWVIREAHKRGLIVYGTFSIAVQKPDYDKALAKCQEFIDLGVDGIWPYLGDPGGEGRSGTPLDLLARVVELGKKHGMTGDLIHFTPGKRGYITIASNDNFAAAKVPGMADALWFFAVKPTPESRADAAKLGLHKKYMWWNHWPHARGGFLSCGNVSQRADGASRHVYTDLVPFSDAYDPPTPQELAKVPAYVDGATCWAGAVWLQETILCPWGWYTWSPQTYDPRSVRLRVYDYLYGPDMVATALELNDLYGDVMDKVIQCGDEFHDEGFGWPPRLVNESYRSDCRELLDKMLSPLEKLEQGASKGSLIDADTLETYMFEPMRAEIAAGKVMIELPRPEYWWDANISRIRMAIREGDCAQALQWQADAEKRVSEETSKVDQALARIVNVGDYREAWLHKFDKLAGGAVYASSPITLDGELTEPAWSAAPKLGPFRVYNDSETTETPSTAQVLYSDDALYVGLTFGEPDMSMLKATCTQHDSNIWDDDSFEIVINTDGYGTPFYRFMANTLGTKNEGISREGGETIDDSWNGDWDVKIAKKADQWTAELRIPYATIGAARPGKDTMWLCNFARNDWSSQKRTERGENWHENSAWGFQPRGQIADTRKLRPVWFR